VERAHRSSLSDFIRCGCEIDGFRVTARGSQRRLQIPRYFNAQRKIFHVKYQLTSYFITVALHLINLLDEVINLSLGL